MADVVAIPVGKWALGYHHPTNASILKFEWTNRQPMTFAIQQDDAVKIAKQILAQYENPPPKRDRLN